MDDTELERVNQRIDRMESGLEKINCELGKLMGQQHSVELILKYVVTPLILIVGALTGVELIH